MSKDDWGIDGFPFVEEQPPQEQEPMTDKTQYCPLCEAAQREIAELDRRVRALDFVVDELKAERLAPIDETVRAIGNIFAFYNNLHPEPADARDFIGAFANQLRDRLTEIRAKYEQGE